MALAFQFCNLRVTLGATNDRKTNVNYRINTSVYADAITAKTAILAALADVSAGSVVGTSLSFVDAETDYSRPTSQDAEWGESATLIVENDINPLKSHTINIPFPKIGLFVATAGVNRDVIDTANADVIAYKDLFSTTGVCTLSDGENCANIISGKRA